MFENKKLKEVLDAQSKEIKDLKKQNKDLKTGLIENNKLLCNILKVVKDTATKKKDHILMFEEATKKFDSKSSSFDKVIRKLELTNKNMEEKSFKRVTSLVDDELSKLKNDVSRFNSLKDEISQISNSITDLRTHIDRFNSISTKIKEQDFDLVEYSKRIEKYEKEKQKLLSKVDSLETIMAKMKQSRPQRKSKY